MKKFKIKVKSKEINRFYPYVPEKDLEEVMNDIFYHLKEKKEKKSKNCY